MCLVFQGSHNSNVLILCTGTSCRSQMAEALINARMGDKWQAFSAGTEPAGYVHSKAFQVLAEIGLEHQGRTKHADEFRDTPFDLVIIVCDSATENCLVWLGQGHRVHIGFPDPEKASGSDEEVLIVFRRVRDDMEIRLLDYIIGFRPDNQFLRAPHSRGRLCVCIPNETNRSGATDLHGSPSSK